MVKNWPTPVIESLIDTGVRSWPNSVLDRSEIPI